MFNPSVNDVRNFFFETYSKGMQHAELTPLEKIAFSVILEHSEYQPILSNPERYLNHNWLPEEGETNPFLHLSMHMSILEQLSINQPQGLKELYEELVINTSDEHEASHQVMDCLAEMIWQSQHTNLQPNPEIYLSCLRQKLGKE
jgi:hypothetical protein